MYCETPSEPKCFDSLDNNNGEDIGIANPASVYCEAHRGTLEIIDGVNGQYGKCSFDDGSFCDEWAYFR
jgi:putative hemolysin